MKHKVQYIDRISGVRGKSERKKIIQAKKGGEKSPRVEDMGIQILKAHQV